MQHGRQQKLSSGVVNIVTDLLPLKTEGQGYKVGKGLDRSVLSSDLVGIKMQMRVGKKSKFRLSPVFEGGLEECSSVKNCIIYSLFVRTLVCTGVLKFPNFLAVAAFTEPKFFVAGVRACVRMALVPSSLFAGSCLPLVLP